MLSIHLSLETKKKPQTFSKRCMQVVAVILWNAIPCMHGNVTPEFVDVKPPALYTYFNWQTKFVLYNSLKAIYTCFIAQSTYNCEEIPKNACKAMYFNNGANLIYFMDLRQQQWNHDQYPCLHQRNIWNFQGLEMVSWVVLFLLIAVEL